MIKISCSNLIFLLLLSTAAGALPSIDGLSSCDDSAATQFSHALLTVRSSLPGVRVFIDTFALGTVPLDTVAIDTGGHILHFVHPDGNQWLYPAMTETLIVHPSEHIERTVHFMELYSVTSEPYGATVQWNDSVLGQTPLRIPLPSSHPVIMLSKDGFQKETVPLSSDVRNMHVVLHPLTGGMGSASSLYLTQQQSKNSMPLYLATGATVLTGAAAAYFKIKADNAYLDFRRNGDQSSLDQVHKFDTLSGVSLVVSELNLLLLTYLLLSR